MIVNRRYEIKNKIGEGRSQVFLIIDKYYPEQLFAMKLISKDSDKKEIQFFNDEYYLLQSFNHKNIIKPYFNGNVFEIAGENNFSINVGDYFFTMEYVDGKILSAVDPDIRKKKLSKIIAQISSVLFYLHQSNLIYYDLKPENIIMYDDGVIKFIDFGFTEEKSNNKIKYQRGTPQLISPEMLSQEVIDFRTDIYSFGILLYWLVFDKYPFENADELEIYKSHISDKIIFPDVFIKPELKFVIKKATEKNPKVRFENTLQLYSAFEGGKIKLETEDFENVNKYYSIDEIEKSLKEFFESESELILEIIGEKKSGKTKLLNKIGSIYNPVLRIDFASEVGTKEIWRRALRDLLLLHSLPKDMFESLLNYIENYFNHPDEKLNELILTFFSRISKDYKFVFMIDNYDKADESSIEILEKLLIMLSINKIKSIVTSKKSIELSFLFGKRQIKLNPLNDKEIQDYIDFLFYEKFPKAELVYLIRKYSEKYIGSINDFIKKLLRLKIISYSALSPIINLANVDESQINFENKKNLDQKCSYLSDDDLFVLSIISSFENVTFGLIQNISGFNSDKVEQILDKLESLQILFERKRILAIKFIAENFADYFYERILDKKSFHLFVSQKIIDIASLSTDSKLAHLEKAGLFGDAVKIIESEILQLESFSAFVGIEKYLKKIISYQLDKVKIEKYKINLLVNYLRMEEFNKANNFIEQINYEILSADQIDFIEFLRGKILYGLGNYIESLKILTQLSKQKKSLNPDEINIELASIYLDISDFKKSRNLCEQLIKTENVNLEIKAKALNLLALNNIYDTNSFNEAAELFQKSINIYEKINNKTRIAALELNLGNVLHILGDSKSAFEHWEKSQQINKNIGNFQHEADANLGLGVYYFNNFNIDEALEKYSRANTIFKTIGNKFGVGSSNYNLAECNIFSLEFKNASENLQQTINVFQEIGNDNELIIAYFLQAIFNIKLEMIDKNILIENKIQSFENIKSSEFYLNALRLLNKIRNGQSEVTLISELKEILKRFYEQKDIFVVAEIFIEILKLEDEIQKGKICKEIITHPIFTDMKSNNFINSIYVLMNYFSPQNEEIELNKFKFLLEAFEKLRTETINEIIIITIYEIVKNYIRNGNLWKAKEYNDILISVFDFASEKVAEVIPNIINEPPFYIKRIKDFISESNSKFS